MKNPLRSKSVLRTPRRLTFVSALAVILCLLFVLDAFAEGAVTINVGGNELHPDEVAQHPYLNDAGEDITTSHYGPLVRNYVLRPLTTPKGTMRFFAGPGDPRMLTLSAYRGFGEYGIGAQSQRVRYREGDTRISTGSTIATLRIGSVYGITDDFEIGMGLPFTFGPTADMVLDDLPVWVTGRFLHKAHLEVGWRATAFAPISRDGALQLGIPIIYRRSIFRLDTGVFGTLHFDDPLTSRVMIPMRLSISFVDAMFVGMSSGIDVRNFSAVAVPVGFHVLFVLEYDNMFMDLGLSFVWPAFLHIFANTDRDAVVDADLSDSLGGILGREGVDFNDFDIQIGANLAIRF